MIHLFSILFSIEKKWFIQLLYNIFRIDTETRVTRSALKPDSPEKFKNKSVSIAKPCLKSTPAKVNLTEIWSQEELAIARLEVQKNSAEVLMTFL